ncbi:biotin-independent malonate decarboxylase subunit gamma [Oxalobacteraceae bacterium]|nr:biotin-independent malonate decarboxylase subunit gamma [Oxalobacteraceae bacterium]
MDWKQLASSLFPQGHSISEQADFLSGSARVAEHTIDVIGTTGHAPIGVEIALAQAKAILRTVRETPGRAILLLVDTQGQRLRHRDEMLGINSYMAHLGKCVELARRSGHAVVALVYDQALSGGFLSSGLMADACHALPEATIRVMGLPAMARITKVPEEVLTRLSLTNPVFAPGPENYERMGGIQSIWRGDLAQQLILALAQATEAGRQTGAQADQRSALGIERGGRKLAQPVINAASNAVSNAVSNVVNNAVNNLVSDAVNNTVSGAAKGGDVKPA